MHLASTLYDYSFYHLVALQLSADLPHPPLSVSHSTIETKTKSQLQERFTNSKCEKYRYKYIHPPPLLLLLRDLLGIMSDDDSFEILE